jgi:hypothetical protein
MRRSSAVLATSALALAAALSACGSSDSSTHVRDPRTSERPGNLLTFTGRHHESFTISARDLTCAVGDYGHGVKTLQISQFNPVPRWNLQVQIVPVARPTRYSLPLDGGDMERGRRNAFLFLGAPHELEVSTTEELSRPKRDAGGRLRVLEATCDPARLRMTIDGTLGSEYLDGHELTVTGGIDLTGS